MDAQTPGTPPASGVGTGVPLPREATDPGGLTPLVPTGPPPVSLKRSRWRVVIVGFLAIVPLLCIAGIAIAFHTYDKATRPDRSTPDTALDNYLQAVLVDHDDVGAALFVCRSPAGLEVFRQFVSSQISYAAALDETVGFTWVFSAEVRTDDQVTIETAIVQDTTKGPDLVASSRHAWTFTVDGPTTWLICGASQTGD